MEISEVKFRGLRTDGKSWEEGFPIYNQEYNKAFLVNFGFGCQYQHEVVPKTVGWFIGITDIYGENIYLGDTVKVTFGDDSVEELKVGWSNELLGVTLGKDLYSDLVIEEIELIDNVHEN